jgi:hypothetical protein
MSPYLQWQISALLPLSLSNQKTPVPNANADATIQILASDQDILSANMLFTRNNSGAWTYAKVALPTGTEISEWSSINSSGVIAAIGTTTSVSIEQHALLLVPVQLVNKADPTQRNGANGNDIPIQFLQSSTDTNIGVVAWIAASDPNNNNAPRMPQLVATSGSPSGVTMCWKLQVTFHDRHGNPHRDFDTGDPNDGNSSGYLMTNPIVNPSSYTANTPDQITIPAITNSQETNTQNGWVQITNGTPWNICEDSDWQAALAQGFLGGDAVLSLKILDSSGNTIMPEQDYKFRIAGENPDPAACQNFINAHCGTYWYAYAIAKQETAEEGSSGYHNHF